MSALAITLAVGAAITLIALVTVLVARGGSGVGDPDLEDAPPADAPRVAPPAPKPASSNAAPMVVTAMATRGFFAIEDASGARVEEPLPESPLGHGEFPMGLWVAPDRTVYVVGKQYTGRPGPDDGVVWRRAPSGAWSEALRLPGRVIGHVTGRSSTEILVGAMAGVASFDGQSWTQHSLPYAQMWKVWSEGSELAPELIAQAFDGSVAYVVSLGLTSMTHAREEPRVDRYSFDRDGVRYRIFDRSTPIGPRTLDGAEADQIRRELAQVQAAMSRPR